jgi:hypothetical protein
LFYKKLKPFNNIVMTHIIKQPIGNGEYLYFNMKGGGDKKKKEEPKKDKDKGEDKDKDKKEGEGEDKDKEKKEGEGEDKDKDKKEGEGEGENSSKDANGKCVGKDSCAGEGAAKGLQAPKKNFDNMDKMIQDQVYPRIKNAWTNLTDKAKCPIYVGKTLPEIIPNMISKIGESTAGAFNNVSNSIKNLFDQVSGQDIKGYPNIFGPFEVAYAAVIIKIQNVINKIALGADADKILADPKIKSGELLDKMMRTSKRYKDAIKDAEMRNIFKDWMKNYTDALLETLDVAKPEVDRINTELRNIIEGMGDNVGESLSHALVNVVKSALANIPVVGGIVSAVAAADELGQEIINACKPPIAKGAGIVMPVVNGVNKQIDKAKCQLNDLAKKIEPIMKKLDKQEGGGGGGGQKKTVKNIGKKIYNTTQRIEHMLLRFGNKQRKTRIHLRRRKIRNTAKNKK